MNAPVKVPDLATVDLTAARTQMASLTAALNTHFLERANVIDGLAAALVAGEHVFLLGEPGTAKSEITEAFCRALNGSFFSTLCNRYQQPDEVIGHWDVGALQKDNRYVRRTERRLPQADVAFLDEVFKGSAALLNTLLRIINERSFENDGQVHHIPLRLVVGASNELPDDRDGLGAFYDRFLLRFSVPSLAAPTNVRAVLFGEGLAPAPVPSISMDALAVLQDGARAVEVAEEARKAILGVRSDMAVAGIRVSDRRWKKAVKLLQARACLLGLTRLSSAHIALLKDVCWDKPEQRPQVSEIVDRHVASWVRDLAKADAAIDEQMGRAATARNKAGKRSDAISALGVCLDAATATAQTVKAIGEKNPAAEGEVKRVMDRLRALHADINKGLQAQGVGQALLGGGQ